jgi:hypothetical protein
MPANPGRGTSSVPSLRKEGNSVDKTRPDYIDEGADAAALIDAWFPDEGSAPNLNPSNSSISSGGGEEDCWHIGSLTHKSQQLHAVNVRHPESHNRHKGGLS